MKPPLKGNSPDDFQTPPLALRPLFSYLKRGWHIWECAEGKGYLTEGLRTEGYRVTGTDILTGHDFLTWQPDSYDCIITNPPFTLKQEFLSRAYSLGKPFAFLLPLTTFETGKRQNLFNRYGIEVIMFDRRINFETPHKADSKSWFATAWFTNWLNIGRQLTFVPLYERPQGKLL